MLHHLLSSHALKISLLPSEGLLMQLSLSSRWHCDWKDPWLYEEGKQEKETKRLVRGFCCMLVTRSLPEPVLDHGSHAKKETNLWHRKRLTLPRFSSDAAEKNLTYKIHIGASTAPQLHVRPHRDTQFLGKLSLTGCLQRGGYRDGDLGEVLHCVMWFSRAGSQWCLLQGRGRFPVQFTPKCEHKCRSRCGSRAVSAGRAEGTCRECRLIPGTSSPVEALCRCPELSSCFLALMGRRRGWMLLPKWFLFLHCLADSRPTQLSWARAQNLQVHTVAISTNSFHSASYFCPPLNTAHLPMVFPRTWQSGKFHSSTLDPGFHDPYRTSGGHTCQPPLFPHQYRHREIEFGQSVITSYSNTRLHERPSQQPCSTTIPHMMRVGDVSADHSEYSPFAQKLGLISTGQIYQLGVCHFKPQRLLIIKTRQSLRWESCPCLVSFCHLPLVTMEPWPFFCGQINYL